jgi:hypothetical protein
MTVVSNSSPLIIYERIGRLDLLRLTYEQILVPPAVSHEVFGASQPPDWLRVVSLQQPLAAVVLSSAYGPGEREAISLALEIAASPLLLDDLPARRIATRLGIEVVGSVGVLLLCKRKKLISSVRPLLLQMRQADFRISDEIVELALLSAGENNAKD